MPLGRAALDFHVQQRDRQYKVVALCPQTQPSSPRFSAWLTLVFSVIRADANIRILLRNQYCGPVSPTRRLHRPHSQRREARRFAGPTGDEARPHHQPQDREGRSELMCRSSSFDHRVRKRNHVWRHFEVERFGSPEINRHFEFDWSLDGKLARFFTLEDAISIRRGALIII